MLARCLEIVKNAPKTYFNLQKRITRKKAPMSEFIGVIIDISVLDAK